MSQIEPRGIASSTARILTTLAVLLCIFVLFEVNYPILQPQSQLAGFALLGLSYLFLSVPLARRWEDRAWRLVIDRLLAALCVVVFGYVFVQSEPICQQFWPGGEALGERAGKETRMDAVFAVLGVLLALEGARRAVGWTLPLLTLAFLLHARYGQSMPGLLAHRGFDWERICNRAALQTLGIYGIALKVMFRYVFPFVLFGAVLERTGATQFVIDLARRLFRRSPGGPAKVAVLSSGMMGSLSGSAVANTATTGTFTIPMMKSSGFSGPVAAGVEAAASSGGALVPPIMGAGAYMMLELIQPPVSYMQIIQAAIVPAILYYLALLLVVHFHARKLGDGPSAAQEQASATNLVPAQGGVFVIAFGVLVLALLLGASPYRAVTVSLLIVLVVAMCFKSTRLRWKDLAIAAKRSAQGAVSLIAATCCVGMILGMVTLTGLATRLPSALLPLADTTMIGALFLLMISTIILGMGLPSAVCYLLMASFVGPALAGMGLNPLAAHLFIFYFGMMSMVTPPVALAAYTAAALADCNILKASTAAFSFALVGFILPYAFVLNPSLLLLPDANGAIWGLATMNIGCCLIGVLLLSAGVTGYGRRHLSPSLRAILVLSAIMLMLAAQIPWLRLLAGIAGISAFVAPGRKPS